MTAPLPQADGSPKCLSSACSLLMSPEVSRPSLPPGRCSCQSGLPASQPCLPSFALRHLGCDRKINSMRHMNTGHFHYPYSCVTLTSHMVLLNVSLGSYEMLSCSVPTDFATPRTVAPQAPLSMGFSRQEYWSRLPFPTPGHLPWPRDPTHVSCLSCIGREFL